MVIETEMLTNMTDLHNVHHSISRQTVSQLRQRIYFDARSRAPRSKIWLGRSHLQFRVSLLGAPSKLPYPASSRLKVHR